MRTMMMTLLSISFMGCSSPSPTAEKSVSGTVCRLDDGNVHVVRMTWKPGQTLGALAWPVPVRFALDGPKSATIGMQAQDGTSKDVLCKAVRYDTESGCSYLVTCAATTEQDTFNTSGTFVRARNDGSAIAFGIVETQ